MELTQTILDTNDFKSNRFMKLPESEISETKIQENIDSTYSKTIEDLTEKLKLEKSKTDELQIQIEQWRQRLFDREIQFRGIIAKYQFEREQSVKDNKSKIPKHITNLHEEVKIKIEQNGSQAQKWMLNRQKTTIQYMQKKLSALRKQMQEKIRMQKALTLENIRDIMTQIEQVRVMALKIDIENQKLLSDIKQLKLKNKVLQQQRNIAIHQTVAKNIKIQTMKKDVNSKNIRIQQKRNNGSAQRAYSSNNSHDFGKGYGFNFIGQPIIESPILKNRRASQSLQIKHQSRESLLKLNLQIPQIQKTIFHQNTLLYESPQKDNRIFKIQQPRPKKQTSKSIGKRPIQESEFVSKTLTGIRGLTRPSILSKRPSLQLNTYQDIKALNKHPQSVNIGKRINC